MHRILFLTLVFNLSANLMSYAQEWRQFGGPNRNFQLSEAVQLNSEAPTKRWQQTLGQGMAGVVVGDGIVYTAFVAPPEPADKEKPDSERPHREVIVALDADNGQTRWRHEYDAGWLKSQQAFGGRARAPQATPALCGDYVVSIGFTGIVHCLDRHSGKVIWKKNLVKDSAAVPVQFGFSASPLSLGDHVVILAGGKDGGLVCFHVETGAKSWGIPCKEASYATPTLWKRAGGDQIVFVTRNRIVGVGVELGKKLWEYELPAKSLTNVPTPLPLDNIGLLISGQGVKGTRRLDITDTRTGYEVREAWQSNEQFFYCNFVHWRNWLLGCNGSLLLLLDVDSGKTIGRFRGFNDANILLLGQQALVFHGDGSLSELELSAERIKVLRKFAVLDERCWTPPTPNGNYLFCRGGDQLLCLDLVGGDNRAALKSMRIRKPVLKPQSDGAAHRTADALVVIQTAYENDGIEAARKLYVQLRNEDPDTLNPNQRRQLAEFVESKGSHDFAKLVRKHFTQDYPVESKPANKSLSSEPTRASNGLVYLEFAIRNTSEKTLQAYVKGPAKHPFSYGLPLRPHQVRNEKWPIGTKLFRTKSGIRQDVLLTVEARFAGKIIDVPRGHKVGP